MSNPRGELMYLHGGPLDGEVRRVDGLHFEGGTVFFLDRGEYQHIYRDNGHALEFVETIAVVAAADEAVCTPGLKALAARIDHACELLSYADADDQAAMTALDILRGVAGSAQGESADK